MILIFILAVQSRWLLILNPHHHCTILTVSGNLKAKIRFSNKWFFKNILLRKQQWENYTKISANPIINFTTALSLFSSPEKRMCIIVCFDTRWLCSVCLCMLMSRLWDTDHLSAWSAAPSHQSGLKIHWSMSGSEHFHCPYLSNTLTPTASNQIWICILTEISLTSMKYWILFDKREETLDVRHNKYPDLV